MTFRVFDFQGRLAQEFGHVLLELWSGKSAWDANGPFCVAPGISAIVLVLLLFLDMYILAK